MCSIWMLVAPQALKSVLPVEDSISTKEMRTFHRIAHQSTSEIFNTSLWSRKRKAASVNYFAIVVLVTNKTCGTFPWQVSVFPVLRLWNTIFWKWLFITMSKKTVSYFNQYSRIFSGILPGQRAQRPTSLLPVIFSVTSSIVFFDGTSWCFSATALLVKLGVFSS